MGKNHLSPKEFPANVEKSEEAIPQDESMPPQQLRNLPDLQSLRGGHHQEFESASSRSLSHVEPPLSSGIFFKTF